MAASDKRAAAFAAQSSVRSHQRRQNGGQRTTGFFGIFVANRSGLLEENFEWDPRQLSANDSELLMPIFASPVAGERCEGYVSIWSPCPQRLSWRTMAAPSNGQGQDKNSCLVQRRRVR